LPPNGVESSPLEVLEKIKTPWAGREMTTLIYLMAWRFCTTKGPSFFVTTDNAATRFVFYRAEADAVAVEVHKLSARDKRSSLSQWKSQNLPDSTPAFRSDSCGERASKYSIKKSVW
jgi:hypothetical protein